MAKNDLNSVILIGNLTRDMELTYTQSGNAIGNISIAVNRSVKRGDNWESETSFFDVTIFGKTAEALKTFLKKGKKIAVNGSLKQDRWEKNGQKYSRVGIMAENIQLLDFSNSNGSQSESNNQSNNNQTYYQPQQNQAPAMPDGSKQDIPF